MEARIANRWVILAASIVSNLCIGSVYGWSVFQKPLINLFKWTPSEASLTFTIVLAMMPISMTIAGKVMEQKGPKAAMVVGGALYGIGIFLAGYSSSLNFLYMTHGIIAGLGVGTVYGCAMSNTVKWFPDKKGLASGLIAGGLGFGAVVFAPLGSYLIASYGVLATLKILGVLYLVLGIGAAMFIKMPPSGYKVPGWQPPAAVPGVSGVDKDWKEMLKDPMFLILWVLYTLGAVSGLMIIGHAASIGQEVIKLSAATAAFAVSIMAMANTGGRVFWGYVSDKIGRYPALIAIYALSAGMMFLLNMVSTFQPFVMMISVIGLCYGGLLGIFPIVCADMFGVKNLGQNYGILFSAFAAAAIIGPRLAARVRETTGNYEQAFLVAAIMTSVGVFLTLFVLYQLKKRRDRQAVQA